MPPKYFYYYKPKAIIITIIIFLVVLVYGYLVLTALHDVFNWCIFLFLLAIFLYLVKDAVIPMAQNKAALIVDEKGISDPLSWGLIEWSNIKELKSARVGRYPHWVMSVYLKNVLDYEEYNRSWWIRLKLKTNKLFTGEQVITMDIDALQGKGPDIFNSIQESYKYYTAR